MALVIDPHGVEADLISRFLPVDGARVLEIGCGDGRLTRHYAARASSVLAIDPDGDSVREARRGGFRDHVRFAQLDATEIDVPPSAIDLVFFSWSL